MQCHNRFIFFLGACFDSMMWYGIQLPDPVALISFSGIIRPLSVMFYAPRGDMAVKVVVT